MKFLTIIVLCVLYQSAIFAQTNFVLRQTAAFDARMENSDFYVGDQIGFSPNENLFFIIDGNRKLTVWETNSRKLKYALAGKFGEAKFSPDEKWIETSSKKEITILNTETGENYTNKYKDEIRFLGWNPNSQNFAVAMNDFTVDILDGATGKIETSLAVREKKKSFLLSFGADDYPSYIRAVFTPDGERIVTTSNDATAEFWEVKTGKLTQTFMLKPEPSYLSKPSYLGLLKMVSPPISSAEISSDGKLVLTGNRLWEATNGKLVDEFDKYSSPSFSPNGHYLKMLAGSIEKGFSIAIYDLNARKIVTVLPKDSGEIAAWSPNEKFFVTDSTNQENSRKQAFIWETETGKQLAELKTHAKYCFDFVSTCISDWDRFSFSPNGEVLMSQSKKEIKFLNPQNGEIIFQSDAAQFPTVWSPKGNYLLSKSKSKEEIILFEVRY